ncbi:MAG: Ig-like domain-containing protein, partial [Gallionellaceae bacterium]
MNGILDWGKLGLSLRLLKIFALSVSLIGLGAWGGSATAAPTWQASSAIAASTGADVTVTLPAHVANDILLLQVVVRDVNDTITWPAGWTQIATVDRGTTARYWWAWSRAVSAAEPNPLVNKNTSTGNTYAAVTTYRGAITTGDPWEIKGTPNTSTAAGHVLNGITTLTAESLIVASLCGENNSAASGTTFSATNPATLAQVLYVESSAGSDGACTAGAGARTAAGATGNVTATWTNTVVGSGGIVLALKPAPPTVISINRADPDPSNAASVSWTVTFSASVTGVSSSNFTLVNSGLGGTPAITSVTGSGNTRTVTASTGTGSGTLGLNMTNTTGVSPALTNLPFTGQVYTMDGTAPVVSSLARVNPTPTALASVSWTVTFSESVTGVNAGDFALVQAGGVSGALITSVTGSGVSWTVTASTGTGNGTLGLNLTDDDSIIDSVSNPLGGTGAGNGSFTGEVYTVTRPVAYYHDTTAGVAIGFDGSTNVTGGDQIITATTPITALLNPVSTCPVTSARSVNHPAGLYTHSRWYLNTNYAVATNIGANPSGSADLRGRGVGVETVIVSLYDYDPVSGAKTQIGSSPAITITGATTAYPYSISSPLYTVPAGHRLMLQYDFNQPTTTDRARVYCSTPSPSYIAVTETAAPLVVSASASTVVANPTSVAADNVTTSTITVTLKTSSGLPVPGKTVTLAAGSGSSVITTVSGTTDAGGVATFTVKDGTVEGPITYTATDTTDSIVITQTAQVTFTAPSLCFADSFAGTLGASWSVGSQSGSWTPAIVSGRLRLTDATTGQSTWATLQRLLPAAGNKVTVEFDYFAYGGSGADGVAVVFSDASEAPAAGAFGGSLGYAQKSNPGSDCVIVGGCPGFAGGWLGIALDEYGNFSNPTEGRYGGTGQVIDSVSIRGSGTGVSGYRFLQGTATLSPGIDGNNVPPGTVAHRYRIIIDHTDSVHAYVSVERDTTSGAGTAYTNLIAPFDVKDPGYSQSAIPVSFNLSFTGSTGASTNIHEIGNLSTCTAQPLVVPTLHHIEIDHGGSACTSGTAPVTVKACADAGCTALYLGNVTVDLSPNAGGALTWAPTEPVTFSGGSAELTLANTTANTQTLGGTATSPTAVNATRCFNGATETCALVFSACTVDAVEVSATSVA